MTESTMELKNELKKSLTLLHTLRDEIAVKVHLATMDAKDRWKALEAQLGDVEKSAVDAATEATRATVDATITKLEKFRASLH